LGLIVAEVANELMYEILKSIQSRMDRVDLTMSEVRAELGSIRGHLIAAEGDIRNIYGVTARIDQRLDRIERRLELHELAEPQRPYDPQ
jgi:DNA anti-recombination protein RmuC